MKKLKILENFFTKDVFLRFSTVFIFIFITFVLAILDNHNLYFLEKKLQSKFLLSSIFFIFISTSIHLFFYKKQIHLFYKIFTWILSFLAVYLSVFLYSQAAALFFLSIILFFSTSAFLFKNSTNDEIFDFNIFLIFSLCFSLLCSSILYGGIEAIILSIDYLFNITISRQLNNDIPILIFSVVFPVLTLFSIIKYNCSTIKTDTISSGFFRILVRNILSPLIFIYALILYVYIIKITLLQDLPKGNLSLIVCVFLSIGILFKILLVKVREHNTLSRFLDKYFIYFMIIPIIFLFIAIYTRVEQYGITTSRYLLIMCSIWFTYLFLSEIVKKRFFIKNAIISLFFLCLFSSITPYNFRTIAINSQVNRLKNIFIKNNMYEKNKVIPAKKELPRDLRIEISSLSSYLIYKKDGKIELQKLLGLKLETTTEVAKYINVEYTTKYSPINKIYPREFDLKNIAINTKAYDYAIDLRFGLHKYEAQLGNKSFSYWLTEDSILNIKIDETLLQLDLKNIVKKFKKEKIKTLDKTNYKKAIFFIKHKNIKVKIFLRYLGINSNDTIYSGRGSFLFSIKN